jgi:sensor domain CHASE-containing protein
MATDILELAQTKVAEEYSSISGTHALLDPTLFIPLITAGLAVLTKCIEARQAKNAETTPQALIEEGKSPTLTSRFMLQREVRETLRDMFGIGAYAKKDGNGLVQALFQALAKSKPEDLSTLIKEHLK